MKLLLLTLALVLVMSSAEAQDPGTRWEYLVISQDEAVASINEPGQQEAFKTWLAANRPLAHKKLSELEAQEASADNARKKLKSIISNVSQSHVGTLAALDYYLNARGAERWEFVSRADGILIFKRRAP